MIKNVSINFAMVGFGQNTIKKYLLMEFNYLRAIIILLSFAAGCAHEILAIFPSPFFSHMTPVAPVLKMLADHGHRIILITPYPITMDFNSSDNVVQIDIGYQKKTAEMALKSFDLREQFDLFAMGLMSSAMIKMGDKIADEIFSNPVVRTVLKNSKLDAVIFEHFGGMTYQAIARWHNCPLIGMSPTESTDHRKMGNFDHILFHPDDKVAQYFGFDGNYGYFKRVFAYIYQKMNDNAISARLAIGSVDLWSKYFWDINYSTTDVDIQISNAHPAMGFQRPVNQNTFQLGFLHIQETKPLPKQIANYLDSATKGVIYVSFGSILNSKNVGKADIFDMELFQQVLAQLDYDIMFTWSGEMEFKADNVRLFEWVPQQDVIAHHNVKMVICHGGLQTIEEAIWFAKPVLTIPFWGDHHANSLRAQELGIGKMLLRSQMTAASLKETIDEILTTPR